MKRLLTVCATLSLTGPIPAVAGNSLVTASPQKGIAKSSLSATPDGEWNRLARRDGKFVELWTRDGDALNKVSFFGGVPVGEPLFKEIDRKNRPLPKVGNNMLITDIPVLLESSYRVQNGVTSFAVTGQEPAQFSGYRGTSFTYSFVGADDVERKGEAVGAFIKGRLYLATYEDLMAFRRLATTFKL